MRGSGRVLAPARILSAMKAISRTAIVLALAAVIPALTAATAPAQQNPTAATAMAGLGLDVSPAKIDMQIPIGARYNMPMTIKNSGANPVHVVVTPMDFKLTGKGEYQFLKVGGSPYSLLKYATINPREFDLPANTTQQVQVTFAMPTAEGSMNGEYAGIVMFQTRPDRKGHNALAFSARVATKLYDVVPNTTKQGGEVTNLVAVAANGGETYAVTFKNAGNTHLYLGGWVEVRQNGQVVDKIRLSDNQLVERNTDRIIEVTGKRLPPGQYEATAAIDYGGSKLSGGAVKFTAP